MSNYQFRLLCSLAWLSLLVQSENFAMAVVSAVFTMAYSAGAMWSQHKESKNDL